MSRTSTRTGPTTPTSGVALTTWGLARASLRHNRRGVAGVFIAVLVASMLVTALGVLLESGLRGGTPPHRLAGADVVVGAPQSLPIPGDMSEAFAERATLPADVVADVSAVDGVERAVGDLTVPLTTAAHEEVEAHGWSSAALTPYTLTAGEEPRRPGDVVVDGSFGVARGDTLTLAHGGTVTEYDVVGTVDGGAPAPQGVGDDGAPSGTVFLTDDRAAQLWPREGEVALVGVRAEDGVDAEALAERIAAAVPDAEVYTGDRRGDVESTDAYGARGMLTALSASFAGTALLVAVFVVANTLALSVAQRRREFALLKAVGTTRGQVHAMIAREVTLVAGLAALLGAGPGYWLASFLGEQFAGAGVIPASFVLARSPLPALAAVLLSVVTALGAAAVAARRPAAIEPVDALRESVVETPALGRVRILTSVVLAVLGLGASLAPLVLPGLGGVVVVASAALVLVIAAGLAGPWIVERLLHVLGPVLRRSRSASVVLADANARGFTRRLSSAVVPLALAIALGSVQLFTPTTVAAEAARQASDGTVADLVVAAPASGISDAVAGEVAALPGVEAVTAVTTSEALVTTELVDDEALAERIGVQGVDPATVDQTLDLGVTGGDLERLAEPGTVALSTESARSLGADEGEEVTFHLGDGAPTTATVVATYERGLGFGDVTMDGAVLRAHTTTGLADHLLVATSSPDGAGVADAVAALGLVAQDRDELAAVASDVTTGDEWVSLLALLVILGYVGLAVVNTLVMATAERRGEFDLLRLVGSTDRQVRRMAGVESLLVVGMAVVIGTAIAIPPLAGIALGVSGLPFPTIAPVPYLLIVGVTALLGVASIAVPTRLALRAPLGG
ncbi:ABC transporter permease [Georgenia faecalis]|uniref:ABC transporter permease n=1 Tax=Georgenia faecalis TaxID=2483799 RepID=UPI000FD87069|nr:FtsX-like permease family protein [Georgenia faecalis]